MDEFERNFRLEYKEILLTAIALARIPAAIDFLEKVLANEAPLLAAAAIRAMAIHRGDDVWKSRAGSAVLARVCPRCGRSSKSRSRQASKGRRRLAAGRSAGDFAGRQGLLELGNALVSDLGAVKVQRLEVGQFFEMLQPNIRDAGSLERQLVQLS